MIKTVMEWIGLGVVLAIALEVVEAPTLVRLAVCAVYALFAFPVVYLRYMATRRGSERWHS